MSSIAMAALSVISLCTLVANVAAWRTEGELPVGNVSGRLHTIFYAGKFCFDYAKPNPLGQVDAGTLNIEIHGQVAHQKLGGVNGLYFMTFDDESVHWPYVRSRWNELSCTEWHKAANLVLPLSPALATSPYIFSDLVHVHERLRPRFWYFAFIDCGADVLQPVKFSIHARNVRQGMQVEFGMDERGSMLAEILCGVAFAGLVIAIAVITWQESRSRPLLRLLQTSAVCSFLGCVCLVLHNTRYAEDGVGLGFAMVLSVVFASMAKALLVILQYFVVVGWPLVFEQAEKQWRSFIILGVAGILALSVGCEIHGEFFRDQSTTLFLYNSWPGHLILALNLWLLGGALLLTYRIHGKETSAEVRSFYRMTSAASLFFFSSLPLVCLLASCFEPWVRRTYVERAELAARLLTTALFLFCLWPSRLDAMVSARPARCSEPLDFEEPAEGGESQGLACNVEVE